MSLQQEVASKDTHINNLDLRNGKMLEVVAKERQLRTAADRMADEASRSAQIEHQRCQEINYQLASTETSLRAARVAVQHYLADDERQLQARRLAMQQWGGGMEDECFGGGCLIFP